MDNLASEQPPFDPIAARQAEVDDYNNTIALFQNIRASLPSDWPEHLVKFKDRKDRHEAIAEVEDLDDVALVSDLWAHDDAYAAIRSNMVERAKAQAILSAMQAEQGI